MDKYNCGGTIISLKSSDENIEIEVGDSGIFAAYSSKIPQIVEVNGHKTKFEYKDNLIVLEVPSTKDREVHTIRIYQ
jgi:Raffinose synthase or seed inhibition protein Sip1.